MSRSPTARKVSNAFAEYDAAYFTLVRLRSTLFPPGTKVRSRIDPDHTTIVTEGSLYADQVNTAYGHMSWRYLERAE